MRKRPPVTRPWQLTQKIRFGQMILDLAVLSAAHYLAYVLRFEGSLGAREADSFAWSLPGVVLLQYLCLACCRVPESAWQYVSLLEVRRITTALAAATLLLFVLNGAADRISLVPPAVAQAMPPRGV